MEEIRRGRFDLAKVGDSAWRVSDARVPEADPARVVAFIECSDRAAQILWMRGSVASPETFRSLDDALDAVATDEFARADGAAETIRLRGDLSRRG